MKLVSRETFSRLCKDGYEGYYDDYIRILTIKLIDIISGKFKTDMKYYNPDFKDILDLEIIEPTFLSFSKYEEREFCYFYDKCEYGVEFVVEKFYHIEDELIFIESNWINKHLPDDYEIRFEDIKIIFYHNRFHSLYNNYIVLAKTEIEKDKIVEKYNKSINLVNDILSKLKNIEGCEQEFVDIIIKQCKDRITYLKQLRDKEVEKVSEK